MVDLSSGNSEEVELVNNLPSLLPEMLPGTSIGDMYHERVGERKARPLLPNWRPFGSGSSARKKKRND